MLDELTADCAECGRVLSEDASIVYRTDAGERRAYECACGSVAITVHR